MTFLETAIFQKLLFARRRHIRCLSPRRFRHVSMAALCQDYSEFPRKGSGGRRGAARDGRSARFAAL